jgi:hypothetical protein
LFRGTNRVEGHQQGTGAPTGHNTSHYTLAVVQEKPTYSSEVQPEQQHEGTGAPGEFRGEYMQGHQESTGAPGEYRGVKRVHGYQKITRVPREYCRGQQESTEAPWEYRGTRRVQGHQESIGVPREYRGTKRMQH